MSNFYLFVLCAKLIFFHLVLKFSVGNTIGNKMRFRATQLSSGKIQFSNAIRSSIEKSLSFCLINCKTNDKCVTLFYHSGTRQCILHSKNFQYTDPDRSENGWVMYLFEDSKFFL